MVLLALVSVYIINPSATASHDPRGRLLGYIPYHFPSASMAPTIERGDYIVVSTFAYADSEPQRGDIISFLYPRDPSIVYAKRVIGLPGDTVKIVDGIVYINDIAMHEPYIRPGELKHPNNLRMEAVTVPDSSLFVLGDNRDNSNDSRYWGFLPRNFVIGKMIK